jgi:hypothetical protein
MNLRNALVASCLVLWACRSTQAQLYTRTDCIAGIQLEWPFDGADKVDVLNELVHQRDLRKKYHVAGESVSEGVIYVQFNANCEQKSRMITALAHEWRGRINGFPNVRLITHPVEPSPSTIDIRGPYWKD